MATLNGVLELLLQRGPGLLEDVGGVDEFGQVVFPGFEALADDTHAGLELLEDAEGGLALLQFVLHEGDGLVFLQVADGLG